MILSMRDFSWEWYKKPCRNKTQCYSLEKWEDFFKELDLLIPGTRISKTHESESGPYKSLAELFFIRNAKKVWSGRKKSTHRMSTSKWLQAYVVADTLKENNPLSVTSALGRPAVEHGWDLPNPPDLLFHLSDWIPQTVCLRDCVPYC